MAGIRVVHYLNQFFAGVGGEDQADQQPQVQAGPLGPGRLLAQLLGDRGDVVATVSCGDNYATEHAEEATQRLLAAISDYRPDVVIAGPAFNAGRYGQACGQLGVAAQEGLGVPALTGMHPENPAVDMYRAGLIIVPTGASAADMREALERMVPLALRLAAREKLGPPDEEGYIPRGVRYTELASAPAARRAVDMLMRRLHGEEVQTEWPLPVYDRVTPPPPLKDLRHARIALVTSGGIVPMGNPGRLESTFATKWLRYSIEGVDDLTSAEWQSVHGGYDTTHANDDPDRILPVDVLREMETEGAIGSLHPDYYVTVGSGASIAHAKRFGQAVAAELADQVDAVIYTAT